MKVKNLRIIKFGFALAGGLLMLPLSALATDSSCTGAGCTANVQVNFSVTIPAFVRFSMGTAAGAASLGYTLTAAEVGSGTEKSATASTNNGAGLGQVAVSVLSNISNVVLSADTSILTNNFAQTILAAGSAAPAWEDMKVVTGGTISHPTSNIAGSAASTVNMGASVVNKSDTWTFTYQNTRILDPGTYTGAVAYTLTAP